MGVKLFKLIDSIEYWMRFDFNLDSVSNFENIKITCFF
jgi:hypothetical protein